MSAPPYGAWLPSTGMPDELRVRAGRPLQATAAALRRRGASQRLPPKGGDPETPNLTYVKKQRLRTLASQRAT